MFSQNLATSPAPGKIAAMPMIAMSDGPRSGPSRAGTIDSLDLRDRGSRAPSAISRWSSAIVVGRVPQRGGLAEHVEAVRLLWRRRPGTSGEPAPLPRSIPLAATRSRPTFRPSSGLADLLGRAPLGEQALALGLEPRDERRGADPDLVPRPGLEQHRLVAADGLLLEPADDRAGGDGLAGEEVGGADQDADLHPARRQRAGQARRPPPPTGRRGCRRRRAG